MKYFIDTEFLEGTQKEKFPISLFRKNTPPTIDLISIGIVSEDGREYYAISKDFNLEEAWNRFDIAEQTPFEKYHQFSGRKVYWIRENVLKPIWRDLFFQADDCSGLSNKQTEAFYQGVIAGEYDQYFTFKSVKDLIDKYGKSNKDVAYELKEFVYTTSQINNPDTIGNWNQVKYLFPIEFYAYYADYDWVAFCWLFGKMTDLPKGFPMYCKDLKQELDEIQTKRFGNQMFQGNLANDIKLLPHYPKQENEHNALSDAIWNKKLYKFLKSIQL